MRGLTASVSSSAPMSMGFTCERMVSMYVACGRAVRLPLRPVLVSRPSNPRLLPLRLKSVRAKSRPLPGPPPSGYRQEHVIARHVTHDTRARTRVDDVAAMSALARGGAAGSGACSKLDRTGLSPHRASFSRVIVSVRPYPEPTPGVMERPVPSIPTGVDPRVLANRACFIASATPAHRVAQGGAPEPQLPRTYSS